MKQECSDTYFQAQFIISQELLHLLMPPLRLVLDVEAAVHWRTIVRLVCMLAVRGGLAFSQGQRGPRHLWGE